MTWRRVCGRDAQAACRVTAAWMVAWATVSPAFAQTPLAEGAWVTTLETWRLPAAESMGMAGGRLLFDLGDGWRVGPGAYGAVSGQRGGFITLGAEVEYSRPLAAGQSIDIGLFLGAGGGRGGRELAGGGLMWRGHAGWSMALSRQDRIGLGVSHVRFPAEGVIRSTQPYLRYERRFGTALRTVGAPVAAMSRDGSDVWSDHSAGIRFRAMAPRSEVKRTDRESSLASFQTLGVEWRGETGGKNQYWTVAADGALGGESAGYMQILVGTGWRWRLTEQAELSLQLAVGPAGGGAVDTGGGLLAEGGMTLRYRWTPTLEASLGWVHQRASGGRYSADGVALGLHYRWDAPRTPPSAGQRAFWDRYPLRVRWVQQRLQGTSADWRCCDKDTPVDALGLAVDRFWGEDRSTWRPFLTGQGLAAYDGRAGAYMQGMLGGGMQWSPHPRWAVELEGTVGAAGGGGLRTGGGLIGQWGASVVWRPAPAWSVSFGAGRIGAFRGGLRAKTVGFTVGYHFDAWRPRP